MGEVSNRLGPAWVGRFSGYQAVHLACRTPEQLCYDGRSAANDCRAGSLGANTSVPAYAAADANGGEMVCGDEGEDRVGRRNSDQASFIGTARLLVIFLRPHLVQRQPYMTRTRPSRSRPRGRRIQRSRAWRVCSLHRAQWIMPVSPFPIGGEL
jgi:hypothetical protein